MTRWLLALVLLVVPQEKRIPPPGVKIPEPDRIELEQGVKQLGAEIDSLKGKHADLIADVQIYHKSVDWALRYDEFFNVKEVAVARELLKTGMERAKQLAAGAPAWATATGLVPRGYLSKIDGSVQPYGLVIPASYKPGGSHKYRLDFWLHGRGETLTELAFVSQRAKSAGEFTPPETIVLHLYGRFCNASKFAGEVDLFEALESVKKRYPIDDDRIVVRGFSMGGASTWHLAVHHAGLWAAANPGAGFAETPVYSNIYKDPVKPTPWQETLWHWYNATDYALNLSNTAVVAYSGEKDKQKAAADTMAKAMEGEGLDLIHIIGPNTEHKYEPEAKKDVAKRIDELAAKGRDANPKKIRFTTWTLRYNEMKWLTIDGLEQHWQRATVEAEREGGLPKVTTKNVSALRIAGDWKEVTIDGQHVTGGAKYLRKVDGKWVCDNEDGGFRKRHGLQGPIDDAFMDSFVLVTPTGRPLNEKVGAWVAAEQTKAIEMWRRFFRGDARVVKDDAVTDADIASSNLVLWGDPSSNKVLARIADKLALRWSPKDISVGSQSYSSETHVPQMIYPNPLNPKRYVVLNSGFTFADQAPLSNARHVPMLPDWAVVDVASRHVVAADFFGERWEIKPASK